MKSKVFINQDSGYLMIDIINAFVNEGFSCTLITGRLVERNISLSSSVKLDKIIMYNRTSIIKRLVSWVYGFLQIWIKVILKYRKADLFIVSNPPLAPLIPLFCRNKYSILIFDIYVEKLSEYLPFGKYSPLSNLWILLHRWVFHKADKIFTLTQGMKGIIEKYSKGKEIRVIPIWTDNNFLKPIPSDENIFIKANKLEGKFVVLYSGNISTTSNLELILQVASDTMEDKILFLIIGDGSGKNILERKARALGLKNCLFLHWQDTQMFPFSLASANIAVVTLPEKSGKMAIPSKLFNYMSVGIPVLSISDPESDLARMVIQNDIGKNFNSFQVSEIKEFIMWLFNDRSQYEHYAAKSLGTSKYFGQDNIKEFIY